MDRNNFNMSVVQIRQKYETLIANGTKGLKGETGKRTDCLRSDKYDELDVIIRKTKKEWRWMYGAGTFKLHVPAPVHLLFKRSYELFSMVE